MNIDRGAPLRFSPAFTHVPIEPDILLLLSERRRRILRGRLLCSLGGLIDGHRTTTGLVRELAAAYSANEVERALRLLLEPAYVITTAELTHEQIFWSNIEIANNPSRRPYSLRIVSLIPEVTEPLRVAIESARMHETEGQPLAIVVTDTYLHKDLSRINREHLSTGDPWLLVKPIGVEVLIGPLFTPGLVLLGHKKSG